MNGRCIQKHNGVTTQILLTPRFWWHEEARQQKRRLYHSFSATVQNYLLTHGGGDVTHDDVMAPITGPLWGESFGMASQMVSDAEC